jgi:GTPase SAR1 family protein
MYIYIHIPIDRIIISIFPWFPLKMSKDPITSKKTNLLRRINSRLISSRKLPEVKLCFVGHARAGKTSTLLALADKPFDCLQPRLELSWVALVFFLVLWKSASPPQKVWEYSMENSGNLLIVITKIVAHDFFHVFFGLLSW